MNHSSKRSRPARPRWWQRLFGAIGGGLLAVVLGVIVAVVMWVGGASLGSVLAVLIAGFVAGPTVGFLFPSAIALVFSFTSATDLPFFDWVPDFFDD
ncbi:MAG: hypothetical protein AAF333_02625 [Planctomycetota bacterium]